ncbi:MAG: glycosyltransferase, partial [Bacteroidales bacterium]|nr:glycosyltransferase [Bacteroidales bacterium]
MLSIITVGMNHRKFIEPLYESLYGIGVPQTEIEAVYVDNCSTDGSVDFLREKYPQVKIIKNTEPLGFGENNNKGVMASTGDYIGIVNPDVVIQKGSIDLLMEYVQQ